MVSLLPCLLGDRWLAQAVTIVVSITGVAVWSFTFGLPFLALLALSLVLVEVGLRLRDRYQRYGRRFPKRFGISRF